MANTEEDPGASTQQFRAYVDDSRGAEAGGRSAVPIVIAIILAVLVIAAVAFFVLR